MEKYIEVSISYSLIKQVEAIPDILRRASWYSIDAYQQASMQTDIGITVAI